MNATERLAYQQKYRRGTTNRLCDCGRPAVKYKNTGFVCPRCEEIERRMYSRPDSQAAYCDRSHIGRKAEYVRTVECFAVHLPRGMKL